MKYMLLIYSNPQVWEELPDAERTQMMTDAESIMKELQDSGEWVGGEALADPVNSKTVRIRDGVPAVTDGPFLEAKEHLAGYCLLDCETLERALDIAARWPDARYNGVELRPLMGEHGTDM
jgi:hypothetical protein